MTDGPCKRKELLPTTTGIYQIRQPATPFHEKSMEYSLLAQQNLLENETILYKIIFRDESDRRTRENYDCMSCHAYPSSLTVEILLFPLNEVEKASSTNPTRSPPLSSIIP
jgi:hypothetical protein